MYSGAVDGVRLHRLGKRLIDLARTVTTDEADPAMTAAEVAVLEDVFKHPGSAVSDIRARTGFAQSHVSSSVARLRARGLLRTCPDPDDRRRTLVTVAEPARRAIMRRASRPADRAVGDAVGERHARRVEELLEELAELLL
jgi:DNA-binding MarR family transcriptional regulator